MKKFLSILAIAMLAACATHSGDHGSDKSSSKPPTVTGGVLVDSKGMTLYTFDKDVPGSGRSNCNGTCAISWPPLLATADAKPTGDFSLVAREGGGMQWAAKGKPLYLFSGDANPGDNAGNGVNGVWNIAKP